MADERLRINRTQPVSWYHHRMSNSKTTWGKNQSGMIARWLRLHYALWRRRWNATRREEGSSQLPRNRNTWITTTTEESKHTAHHNYRGIETHSRFIRVNEDSKQKKGLITSIGDSKHWLFEEGSSQPGPPRIRQTGSEPQIDLLHQRVFTISLITVSEDSKHR